MGCAFCGGNTGTLARISKYSESLYCTECRKSFAPEGWQIPDDDAAKAEREADHEEKEVWW